LPLSESTESLWGANIRPSSSDFVLVEQSAQPVASPDLAGRCPSGEDRRRRCLRSQEARNAVWSVRVVVADILGQRPFELTAVDDEDPVEALPPE
jgi:hypothetical protein